MAWFIAKSSRLEDHIRDSHLFKRDPEIYIHQQNDYMAPRARGEAPLFCIGCLWQGIEAKFRGLIPIPYLFASVAAFSRLRWFRFGFVCAVVSRHQFIFASGVGSLLCGGFVFASLYLCVSYSDRSSKLTIF